MLSVMKATSLELFFFDHCEGVHQNLLQRLKPRCLFEIELRPSWGQRLSTIIDRIGQVEVNTEQLVPGRPQHSQKHYSSTSAQCHESTPLRALLGKARPKTAALSWLLMQRRG